jgi:hypothetical protein
LWVCQQHQLPISHGMFQSRIEQHRAQKITLLHSTCDVENTIAAANNSGLSSVQPAQHLKVRVWNTFQICGLVLVAFSWELFPQTCVWRSDGLPK